MTDIEQLQRMVDDFVGCGKSRTKEQPEPRYRRYSNAASNLLWVRLF
jgi:hypothetical protein